MAYEGYFAVMSGLDDSTALPEDSHTHIDTGNDEKNVRINSRDFTQTSGSGCAAQIKPNQSVDGTASVTGLEVSPRFADGIGGNDLRGILADPNLKGTTGDLTGQVVAVECNIDMGDAGSTRTIAGDLSALSSFLDLPSGITVSGKATLLRVRGVNAAAWDAFLNLDDANTGLTQSSAASGGTSKYLKVYIGDTLYTIEMTTA
jgi:hypothetical protein